MTDPRWLEVAKKEPTRWIEHDAPYEGHYAQQMCQVCLYNPVGPSEKEYADAVEEIAELKAENQRLAGENLRLSDWAERAEKSLREFARRAGRAGGRASGSQMRGAR